MDLLAALKKFPVFEKLGEEAGRQILKKLRAYRYPPNHFVFREGEPGDAMYVIHSGRVLIHRVSPEGEEIPIVTLGPKDYFGEMALVADQARNACAKTLESTQLFVLKKEDFCSLVAGNPAVADRISHEFLRRMERNMRKSE